MPAGKRRLSHAARVAFAALAAGAPAVVVALGLLLVGEHDAKTRWTLGVLVVVAWAWGALVVHERVTFPLRTVANMLWALREGDYSLRLRRGAADDALSELHVELNALGDNLREQRLGALEATALLRNVMAEIDVAVLAFDAERRLKLVNRAGERLLGRSMESAIGRSAEELSAAEWLEGDAVRTLEVAGAAAGGRWSLRRSEFREGGRAHQLVVLSDLSRALREEERQAWQRIVRVLGHELNNSLAPIRSMAGTLVALLERVPRAPDFDDDMRKGLSVISGRAESLARFMSAYARLARLPRPTLGLVEIGECVRRVAELETRMRVEALGGPTVEVPADADQVEQLLINLVRNGVDAALETGGRVFVRWMATPTQVHVSVEDEGPGLASSANLFVPFFTTKPGGSGIGLVLSRQIAESHGGSLTVENREGGGCVARLRLPRRRTAAGNGESSRNTPHERGFAD